MPQNVFNPNKILIKFFGGNLGYKLRQGFSNLLGNWPQTDIMFCEVSATSSPNHPPLFLFQIYNLGLVQYIHIQ